jgi:nicotinate-nucleotide pyrophosphorylase (carboxylating)
MKDVMRSARAQAAVRLALDEDLADAVGHDRTTWCDATSEALVDADVVATGEIYAKGEGCVVSGATVARAVMKAVDPRIRVTILKPDGSRVEPLEPILAFRGRARSILAAERTALNFMQRMCATATLTSKFVEATKAYGTMVLDTRKTTPGLRVFEKYAVKVGGGTNHRYNLSDGILLKDNHIGAAGGVKEAVEMAKAYAPFVRKIEIEVEDLNMLKEALEAGADIIMLDNMSVEDMKTAVELCRGKAETECSGNVTRENIARLVDIGVDYISSGALTHSSPILDLSLKNLHAI